MSKTLGIIGAALLAVAVFNATVAAPVAMELSKDERNAGITMVAYRALGVHPRDITIDLLALNEAAPIDLYRALFQSAAALKGRHFDRVVLAHQGGAVFIMGGDDFASLGADFAAGENPIYLIRTLPEKLHLPDGTAAYGSWTGGVLGVLSAQMEDVSDMAQNWAGGQ